MCGIAGFFKKSDGTEKRREDLRTMLHLLKHRGPDGEGFYENEYVGLAHARLAVIGVKNGSQPIVTHDGRFQVVCAGEIFNEPELRKSLESEGVRFKTESDCEVIAHLYEKEGVDFLQRINGQFALALWDDREKKLLLARDRFGICPLFYSQTKRGFYFASEIKSILSQLPETPEVHFEALASITRFWTTIPGETMFQGIGEVFPGQALWLTTDHPEPESRMYWTLGDAFTNARRIGLGTVDERKLESVLEDAVRIRLRSEVGVGVYVSGGIDSSSVAWLARRHRLGLLGFSIQFDDGRLDESAPQSQLAAELGLTWHPMRYAAPESVAAIEKAVWHAEQPFLRSSPLPFFNLSAHAKSNGASVILAGEGADEFLLGYAIYKEAKLRAAFARGKSFKRRMRLLERVYPEGGVASRGEIPFMGRFLVDSAGRPEDPFFSHQPRWSAAQRIRAIFSEETRWRVCEAREEQRLSRALPKSFFSRRLLERAQILESTLFMSQYLLSVQGDRMAMAHGVEVRYPFLDHRVVEAALSMSDTKKLSGLKEKIVLRRLMKGKIAETLEKRPKKAYRAPSINACEETRKYFCDNTSVTMLRRCGFFDEKTAELLRQKVAKRSELSVVDEMAACGLLTTLLWHDTFIKRFREIAGARVV